MRLDAVARFLQDIAIDDVQETGWGLPEHLWFVRSIRVDVVQPFAGDTEVELTTWCSGVAAIAAGRRWSVKGDAGGSIEVDSVWIHLDAEQRPARIEDFGVYADAAAGRHVDQARAARSACQRPAHAMAAARDRRRSPRSRQQRVHWQAVEDTLPVTSRLRAELDYRQPLDLEDELELAPFDNCLGFVTGDGVKAVARVTPI